MRSFTFITVLVFSLLVTGCNRSSQGEKAATPPPELLGDGTQSSGSTPILDEATAAKQNISLKDAGNAGVMLVLARDTCKLSRSEFDRLARYFSSVIGEDIQLKAAFVGGAKAAALIHQHAVKKGELDKLKRITCPGVDSMLAALPSVKKG
jgi:hypothetical protein